MSNHAGALPDQEVLRRRLKAARLLSMVSSLEELAGRIDPTEKLSARTLRKLENAESEITLRALRPIAEALAIPLEWFTTREPVWAPYESGGSAFERRLARLEEGYEEILRLRALVDRSEAGLSATQRPSEQPDPRGSPHSTAQ